MVAETDRRMKAAERRIAGRLRELRMAKGMEIADLASRLRVGSYVVSKWERAVVRIPSAWIEPICNALGCDANDLLRAEPVAPPRHWRRYIAATRKLTSLPDPQFAAVEALIDSYAGAQQAKAEPTNA